ncbi:MAG TPA: hypothetical protein VE959_34735 [Bryobacteraceae bacterium]|nr:hypothetical protein [Bryobacteraceae bacterium]
MTGLALHQRCWNHEAREAVCRCPECGRSYCRECVTEHEARLLCAACLQKIERAPRARRPGRRVAAAVLALAGILFAWLLFYGAGEAMILITSRMEQASWQTR